MVYRREGVKRFSFEGRTPTGRKQMSTGTTDKTLARQIEAMWEILAEKERAWDLLLPVLQRERRPSDLWDLWQASGQNVIAMRRLLADVDLVPLVTAWQQMIVTQYPPDTVAHLVHHVRTLLPEGKPLRASQVTPAWLTRELSSYMAPSRKTGGERVPVRRNTRRKVHSSWSQFFDYATRIHGAFPSNPMLAVDRPSQETSPIRFYEMADVERIIAYPADPLMRVFFALVYGTAADVSPALTVTRDAFQPHDQSVRVLGTKAHTRDRVSRVAEWAWPMVWAEVRLRLPGARVFPASWSRYTVSDAHAATVKALGLPAYPLRNSRDHWAVRMLRAGAPIAVVQAQLGHGSPMLTLTKYGRFLPETADRTYWEDQATRADQRRRAVL